MRVMLVVTHLLGVGHLTRTAALSRAFARAGHEVMLVSGGRPTPTVDCTGYRLVQLPSVHVVGTDFRSLFAADGSAMTDKDHAIRQRMLLDAFAIFRPQVLIVELFPFGRRQLAAEFEALLAAARGGAQTIVFSSIRDVLNPTADAAKDARTEATLGRLFDGVLVHSDPDILPLEASFPASPALNRRLHYTGYVVDMDQKTEKSGLGASGDVIVSGGGSAAGLPLARAALEAAAQTDRIWRVLVGHGVNDEAFADLMRTAPANAIVERARADFPQLLASAACSVSQFGYNTALDLVRAGIPAVVVPFDAGNEREQTIRAERFAAMGLIDMLPARDLSGHQLHARVEAAIARRGQRPPLRLDMDGAQKSVTIAERAVKQAALEQDAWRRLEVSLNAAAAAGRNVRLWWRDDDAVDATPALDRLLTLSRRFGAPVALAVIPDGVRPGLLAAVAAQSSTRVLAHGIAHRNHAAAPAKKQELVAADAATLAGLAAGRVRLAEAFGPQFLPVLVPPWNRIADDIRAALPQLGFMACSTFANSVSARSGNVPTHLDPIDWKGGGGLVPPTDVVARLAAMVDQQAALGPSAEPIGLLTHHLVHDEWVWRFIESLLGRLTAHPAVIFQPANDVFGLT